MASSRRHDDLAEHVAARLTGRIGAGSRVTLALSGGVDSVVLFDILRRLQAPLDFRFSALHVNHQISPNAPAWGRFCAGLCERHGVPYAEEAVTLDRTGGESLEALAREARYRVLARCGADFVALAQHLDDQAETVLLQLLRGAGVKGLSGMPAVRGLGDLHILRPLLDVTRARIMAYADKHRLAWVEDESNRDIIYDRNFLRHDVLPVLERRFPACRQNLARASRHFAEAAGLLDELASSDAHDAIRENRLNISALRLASPARGKNLLRYFLDLQGVTMPSALRLDDILRQLTDARPDARIHIQLGEFELRRYRDEAYVLPRRRPDVQELSLPWHFERYVELPCGHLSFEPCRGEGISLARLRQGPLTLRSRRGGERLRPVCGRPSRSLKNLLQETAVPPWRRESLPLLFCGEELVFVPEVGIDCAYRAGPDEEGLLAKFENSI